MTLPQTLQAARDFISCHTCGCIKSCGDGRLNKGECHRHNAKLIVAMIDGALAELSAPAADEVEAVAKAIDPLAYLRKPAEEIARAAISALDSHRTTRTEPPVPPHCVKPLLERLREYLCKRSDAMGGEDNSEEVYFIWEIDAAMARPLRAAERGEGK